MIQYNLVRDRLRRSRHVERMLNFNREHIVRESNETDAFSLGDDMDVKMSSSRSVHALVDRDVDVSLYENVFPHAVVENSCIDRNFEMECLRL